MKSISPQQSGMKLTSVNTACCSNGPQLGGHSLEGFAPSAQIPRH